MNANYPEPHAPVKSETHKPVKSNSETNTWAMFLHLSQLLNVVVPLGGFAAPITIWLLKKDEMPELDAHGKCVANWLVNFVVLSAICVPLCFLLIGIPLLIAVGIAGTVFPIIGGLKANEGKLWPYPMTFIKVFK